MSKSRLFSSKNRGEQINGPSSFFTSLMAHDSVDKTKILSKSRVPVFMSKNIRIFIIQSAKTNPNNPFGGLI